MVSSSKELAAYDAGWSPEFQRAADLALVVEGEELPVHSQFMARESQVRGGELLRAVVGRGTRPRRLLSRHKALHPEPCHAGAGRPAGRAQG